MSESAPSAAATTAAMEGDEVRVDPLEVLPAELALRMCGLLPAETLAILADVSLAWRRLVGDASLWRTASLDVSDAAGRGVFLRAFALGARSVAEIKIYGSDYKEQVPKEVQEALLQMKPRRLTGLDCVRDTAFATRLMLLPSVEELELKRVGPEHAALLAAMPRLRALDVDSGLDAAALPPQLERLGIVIPISRSMVEAVGRLPHLVWLDFILMMLHDVMDEFPASPTGQRAAGLRRLCVDIASLPGYSVSKLSLSLIRAHAASLEELRLIAKSDLLGLGDKLRGCGPFGALRRVVLRRHGGHPVAACQRQVQEVADALRKGGADGDGAVAVLCDACHEDAYGPPGQEPPAGDPSTRRHRTLADVIRKFAAL